MIGDALFFGDFLAHLGSGREDNMAFRFCLAKGLAKGVMALTSPADAACS